MYYLFIYLWLNIGAMLIMSLLNRSRIGRNYALDVISIFLPLMYVPHLILKIWDKVNLKEVKVTKHVYDTDGNLIIKESKTKQL